MSVLHQTTDIVEGPTQVARTPRPAWTVAALLGADVAALAVAALAAAAIGAAFDPAALLRCLPFVLVAPVALAIGGLYPGAGRGPVAEYRRLSGALLVAAIVGFGPVAIVLGLDGSALVSLACLALALATVPSGRALVRERYAHRHWWGVPVVVAGDARSASGAIEQLLANPRLGLKPVARTLDDTSEAPTHVRDVPVVDGATPPDRRARPMFLIVHGAGPRPAAETPGVAGDVAFVAPVDVKSIGITGVTPTRLDRALAAKAEPTVQPRRAQGVVKRGIDLFLALPFAVAAAPLIVLAALAIVIASPGTPFYYQVRVGLGGRRIRVWKLRTMYVDAAERLARHLDEDPSAKLEWLRSFKLGHDPRILPGVGSFLRASSIDELPQVFNVLIGDMSFVGPRPFPEYHLAAFDDEFRQLRTTVRPGITGLWQVTARSDGDLDVQRALDGAYIQNWSLGLDLYLLARTPLAVLSARGAR